MQKHTLVYFRYFNISFNESGWHDPIFCEWCGAHAVDIHHINGRHGKSANSIENLVALCRGCHQDAHDNKIGKQELINRHERNLERH